MSIARAAAQWFAHRVWGHRWELEETHGYGAGGPRYVEVTTYRCTICGRTEFEVLEIDVDGMTMDRTTSGGLEEGSA